MKRLAAAIIAIGLIPLGGCNDELFLEPTSQLSLTDFYKTADDIDLAVAGAYDPLQDLGQYGTFFKFFMEARSDNSFVEDLSRSGGSRGEFDVFTLIPSNSFVNMTWVSCYKGIQRCNVILDQIDDISMDEVLRDTRKGEVLFLRALTYFNMVRIWGDIPLVTTSTRDPFDAFEHSRDGIELVYQQIVKDLITATEVLPTSTQEAGRATKGAAQALLGKVYLTQQKYKEAETELSKVVDAGNYRLLDEYTDIFGIDNENNQESIFEVQFEKGGLGEGNSLANDHAPINASELVGNVGNTVGDALPTPELVSQYTASDKRAESFGQLEDGRYYSRKYMDVPTSNGDGGNNVIVLRYADVLLMYAEALNEQSFVADGKAFDLLDQVRNRAGLAQLTSVELTDQQSFRLAIEQERKLELAFENHRWFDLTRTGRALQVMQAHNYPNPNVSLNIGEHQLLFPIPQAQIDASPDKIKQNPGF